MPKQTGFTLIEVLIALMIIAIAFTAIIKTTTYDTQDAIHVKQKMLANWVAQQALTKIQLGLAAAPTQQQPVSILGETYHWSASFTPTPNKRIAEIAIQVMPPNSNHVVLKLYGFKKSL